MLGLLNICLSIACNSSKSYPTISQALMNGRRSQLGGRVEAKKPALLSSRDGYLWELTGWTQGSQASCGVWREVARLVARPCRRRRPSSLDDGGISGLFSSSGPSVRPNLSRVFQELLSVYLFVFGNIEFVLTMLGLCRSLEVARTSGLQSPISC